jgi:hypothetical protein
MGLGRGEAGGTLSGRRDKRGYYLGFGLASTELTFTRHLLIFTGESFHSSRSLFRSLATTEICGRRRENVRNPFLANPPVSFLGGTI